MYEELFRDGDIRKDTGHSDIFAAVTAEAESALSEEQLQGLKHLSTEADIAAMLTKIKELIPAYTGWPRHPDTPLSGWSAILLMGRGNMAADKINV